MHAGGSREEAAVLEGYKSDDDFGPGRAAGWARPACIKPGTVAAIGLLHLVCMLRPHVINEHVKKLVHLMCSLAYAEPKLDLVVAPPPPPFALGHRSAPLSEDWPPPLSRAAPAGPPQRGLSGRGSAETLHQPVGSSLQGLVLAPSFPCLAQQSSQHQHGGAALQSMRTLPSWATRPGSEQERLWRLEAEEAQPSLASDEGGPQVRL